MSGQEDEVRGMEGKPREQEAKLCGEEGEPQEQEGEVWGQNSEMWWQEGKLQGEDSQVWGQESKQLEDEEGLPRFSSINSGTSQVAGLEFSQPLSDILLPGPERVKVSRAEALELLNDADTATEAAGIALKKVLEHSSSEELEEIDGVVNKIRLKMIKLQQKTRKSRKKVTDPDGTFLSLSTFEELNEWKLEKDKDDMKDMEKGTQTEVAMKSRVVQTDGGFNGPFRKPFDQLVDVETQKKRSTFIMEEVRRFAEGNQISVAQAAGYILHRQYWTVNRALAELGGELFRGEGNITTVSEVPTLTCLWVQARNNIGRAKFTNIRLQLLRHVKLQPYGLLSELRRAICPALHPWPPGSDLADQRGVYANLGTAVKQVLHRMVQYGGHSWLPSCSKDGGQCANLVATIHCSGDGRGDEKQYGQRSQAEMDTSHVMSFVFSVPSISLALEPKEEEVKVQPAQVQSVSSTELVYQPCAVLPKLRQQQLDGEPGVRVWALPKGLEEQMEANLEPESKRRRVAGGSMSLEVPAHNMAAEEEMEKPAHALKLLTDQMKKPLGFQHTGRAVWSDPEPQSSRAMHPWVLSHEREMADNVKLMYRMIIDPQVEELRSFMLASSGRRTSRDSGWGAGQHGDQERVEDLAKPVLLIAQPCGHTVSISADISLKGLDTKMIRGGCGRTGAFCYLCKTTRKGAHSLEVVRQGFLCDMSAVELLEMVEDWLGPEVNRDEWDTYEFVSKKGDEGVRFGMKHAPYSTIVDTVNAYAVLHTGQLRLYGWVEQFLVRLCSNCPWGIGRLPEDAKQRKELAEEEWKGEKLGKLIGFRHLRAPNQVTGNMVKLFFSEERRGEVVEALGTMSAWQSTWEREMMEEEKEQIRSLLQRLSVINRVMSCDSVVKIFKFRSYCLATYEVILATWPWASVSETLHRLLGHTWEFLVLNNNCGLLRQGEGGSESMHHVERDNRQYGSRKVSLVEGNEDTFR